MNIKKLSYDHSAYPSELLQLHSVPKELFILGELSAIMEMPRLAVVGSRKVSPYGRQVTDQLVREVSKYGIAIISGLAIGVDSIAHNASLEAGGKTLAVLPCGLDKIYPAQHHNLAKKILERGGALISEYSEGTPPLRQHFIARNRIVAALSNAVLITEAAERSGTLHTANFALEQGKTVLAVPGNITSPTSGGTNNLIKSGAVPVTCTQDILTALGLKESALEQRELFGANEEETLVLSYISQGITDSSELLVRSKLDAPLFNQTLTMLEINGQIRPLGAGHWTLY